MASVRVSPDRSHKEQPPRRLRDGQQSVSRAEVALIKATAIAREVVCRDIRGRVIDNFKE